MQCVGCKFCKASILSSVAGTGRAGKDEHKGCFLNYTSRFDLIRLVIIPKHKCQKCVHLGLYCRRVKCFGDSYHLFIPQCFAIIK